MNLPYLQSMSGAFRKFAVALLCAAVATGLSSGSARAQEEDSEAPVSLLADVNGDGAVRMIAFGDSITFGVGDGTVPGQVVSEAPRTNGAGGYCARVETAAGVLVDNKGEPGEELAVGGIERFPGVIAGSAADIVILFEGSNDALNKTEAGFFHQDYQRAVNVAKFLGKVPVVASLPPTCCDRAGRKPFIDSLNGAILSVAAANELRIADLAHAFDNYCANTDECDLLNIPEGLHPNTRGYDLISQVILAAVSGIDIFAPEGAANLESAFNLPPGSVIVKPNPVQAAP